MKVAFVHEYLNQSGGAERVLEVLCTLFPQAPIYTLLYDARATGNVFQHRKIITSFLQRIPGAPRYHRLLPLLMPIAIEQFDLSAYDLVISNAHSFAKGIITKPYTKHISYCATPSRFLWDDSQQYIHDARHPWPISHIVPFGIAYLRVWDHQASARVDNFIAISDFVRQRIGKYYQRDSQVVYPPVRAGFFQVSTVIDDYFLMVGRLVSYKRFDAAIKVFNAIGKQLKIVGDGPELKRLKKMAGPTVHFLGRVSDAALRDLYQHAQALIFPQEEDFGIVPLESMASGRPVIAYRGGGALETIVDRITGILFDEQTEIGLAQAIGDYYHTEFDPLKIHEHALNFDVPVFIKTFKDTIDSILK